MIGYTYSTWPNFKAKLGPKADGLSELTAFPARYPYYIAFSKKTSDELINKLNAVLAKMRDKGIVAKIYKKHAKLDPGL